MNYQPVFTSVPDNWLAKWGLIREFIRRWHSMELPEAGRASDLAVQEEKKLGFALPPSFREWISLASELTKRGKFDIFRDVYEVTHLRDLSATSLLLQCEGDVYWAVRNQNLGFEDPPVELFWLDHRLQPERFVWFARDAEHITSFALGHLPLYGRGGGCGIEITPNDEFLREMESSFDTHAVFDDFHIFEKPNIIAKLFPSIFENRRNLVVEVWKDIPRTEIPECILALTGHAGSLHGMFLPKR